MIAHFQVFRRLFQRGDDARIGHGGKILGDIIARGALAAQRAGDDHQIADFDVVLQRAAAADADQRLRAGAAKNLRRDRRVRRVAAAVADADALAVELAGVHLVVEKSETLLRLVQELNIDSLRSLGPGISA